MKKVLLASVALVALGAASAQASEPLKLTVGGFLQEMVGYVDNHGFNQSTAPGSVHLSQVDVNSLGLIQFKASTTLDNGISAAVKLLFSSASTAGCTIPFTLTVCAAFSAASRLRSSM